MKSISLQCVSHPRRPKNLSYKSNPYSEDKQSKTENPLSKDNIFDCGRGVVDSWHELCSHFFNIHIGRPRTSMLLLVLLLVGRPMLTSAAQVRLLSCDCNTVECQREGTATCHTDGQCYSQRWDRLDESRPIVRGCLTAGSLLCMNQRPKGHQGSWPFLDCCNTYLCNRDVSPTLPSTVRTLSHLQDAVTQRANSLERLGVSSVEEFRQKYSPEDPECDQDKLTMLYLGVTGAALILMVVMTVVGFYVLYSYRRRYSRAPGEEAPVAVHEKGRHVPLFLQSTA